MKKISKIDIIKLKPLVTEYVFNIIFSIYDSLSIDVIDIILEKKYKSSSRYSIRIYCNSSSNRR